MIRARVAVTILVKVIPLCCCISRNTDGRKYEIFLEVQQHNGMTFNKNKNEFRQGSLLGLIRGK
jgi:hypothetical protein